VIVLVFALTVAFPPWVEYVSIPGRPRIERNVGFRPLIPPPEPSGRALGGYNKRVCNLRIATDQLLLEWVLIAALGGVALLCFRGKGDAGS